jgi:hypothetical protein
MCPTGVGNDESRRKENTSVSVSQVNPSIVWYRENGSDVMVSYVAAVLHEPSLNTGSIVVT